MAAILLSLLLLATSGQVFSQKKKKTEQAPSANRQRESEFYFTDGEKYFILEDYAKALLYYQKALEATPDNATIYYRIADVLAKGGRADDLTRASLSIEQALKLEKGNKYFYLLAVSIYNNLARFDKSVETYQQMISNVAGTEEYLYDLAKMYQFNKQPEQALQTYARAEQIFGVNEISSLEKIRIHLAAGRTTEVVNEGMKLISAFPDDERYAMAVAETLSQNGKPADAIQILEPHVLNNNQSANAKMLLAGLYRDAQRESEARALLLDVFNNPEVEFGSKIIVLSTYSMELNQARRSNTPDSEKAMFVLQLYELMVKAYPTEASVFVVGGDLFLSMNQPQQAVDAYHKGIELEGVGFDVWQNLLYAEMQLDQYDGVLKDADRALELYPNQGMLHYFYGYACFRKHKNEQAAQSLEQARSLLTTNKPLLEEVNTLLGDTYQALGQYAQSEQAFDAVLLANPQNETALNNYSYYLSLRKQNLDKAERMSAQLIKLHPDNPTYLDTYAWVLYMKEKYKEARKQIESAINSGRANSTHLEHYGDILFKLGDVNGAVAQWEKARGLGADNDSLDRKIANRRIYE
jgi:tetratricopeptide (TPR) repeat protein